MSVELAYSEYGDGPPLLILHGLFGSARNWRSVAKRLASGRRVISLDLRNHGASPLTLAMSYPDMAGDIAAFIERHRLENVTLLGHSMGGKTAMTLALQEPELITRLIVVDIAPVSYAHSLLPYVKAMQALDTRSLHKRSEAEHLLQTDVPDAAVRGFLLQNLAASDEGFIWRINLPALAQAMPALTGFPQELTARRCSAPTLFVRGMNSDYIQAGHHATIRGMFPAAQHSGVPGAGHWVHAEQPRQFLHAVEGFLVQS